MGDAIEGSCLCGGVRYSARGPLHAVARCYCVFCRKQSGAEFATNGSVAANSFTLHSGEDLLREFESSPGQMRIFCATCGSSVFKKNAAEPDRVRLRLGCVDSELSDRVALRVFASRRLALSEIDDDLPTFDTAPGAPPATEDA